MELKTNTGSAVTVSETAFGRDFNEALVHQIVTAYMAAVVKALKHKKHAQEVSGGGIKPWRQKKVQAVRVLVPLTRQSGAAAA